MPILNELISVEVALKLVYFVIPQNTNMLAFAKDEKGTRLTIPLPSGPYMGIETSSPLNPDNVVYFITINGFGWYVSPKILESKDILVKMIHNQPST